MDSSREFRADPVGYVKGAFAQDEYGKKRAKIIFLGSALSVILLLAFIFIGLLIQFLKTPDITGVLEAKSRVTYLDPALLPPLPAPEQKQRASGGGGGGLKEPNPPSFGKLPRAELKPPLISPTPHPPKIEHPSLPVEPTIMAQPELLPQTNRNLPFGDPTSISLIPSAGPGSGGGIGTGRGGGVGPGSGPGYGPGEGGNTGGGRFGIGGGDRAVRSRPQILNQPRPDWTEEARRNRIQGEVLLSATFAADGEVRNIRIVRGLGYGLDEKAIEAAKLIRFVPARDPSGNSIDYRMTIRVDFRLL
jgi:TonB family protein